MTSNAMKIQSKDGYITCDATSGEFQETTNAFSANQQTRFLVVVLNIIMWSKMIGLIIETNHYLIRLLKMKP